MCCWNFSSLLKGIPEQVMLAAVEHGTFCGLYLQYFFFFKSFHYLVETTGFFPLVSLSMFHVSVLTFSILLFILASLLYPTIFVYCSFFVLFSSFSNFFDKHLPWDVGMYHFVGSICCFSLVNCLFVSNIFLILFIYFFKFNSWPRAKRPSQK